VRALVIAIGNGLRSDDGIAHRVADLLTGVTIRRVHQLTPEVAAGMQEAETVIFLDADPQARHPSIEPIRVSSGTAVALSHAMTPETVIAIASRLYGFHGEAWLCRLYARDFSASTELSPEAAAQLQPAAQLVQQLLEARCTSPR